MTAIHDNTCNCRSCFDRLRVALRECGETEQLTQIAWWYCQTHADMAHTDEPIRPDLCFPFNLNEPCVLVPLFFRAPQEQQQ